MLSMLLILFFTNYILSAATLKCGPNQVVVQCPSFCASDYCPTRDGEVLLCPQPTVCPKPACKCMTNYRRAKNGTCIPTRQCPAFDCPRINEVYNPCPLTCPTDSCTQASPTGACPPLGAIGGPLICNPRCRCMQGYWRVENGTCVAYKDCPGVTEESQDYDDSSIDDFDELEVQLINNATPL